MTIILADHFINVSASGTTLTQENEEDNYLQKKEQIVIQNCTEMIQLTTGRIYQDV
ncbi:hypothetical protein [Methanoplanus endosymbiosus]|uniref:Uncharacterized protein n=1 Tax=Methanoplanus endosymbiosus TaxID=33865 RepID=A0A9E7TLF4_9EURY|nr:hypothetical protein [Methanoplanus endosymbiosus]UUX93690.1 hypothetical protein L6E24_06130 [Methanoplanus endosymbiosus]